MMSSSMLSPLSPEVLEESSSFDDEDLSLGESFGAGGEALGLSPPLEGDLASSAEPAPRVLLISPFALSP